jgi:hypothetical protein
MLNLSKITNGGREGEFGQGKREGEEEKVNLFKTKDQASILFLLSQGPS